MSIYKINTRQYIVPDWPAPSNIHAFTTTRIGGASNAAWSSFNQALNVGDNRQSVLLNQQYLIHDWQLPNYPHKINQVHGGRCIELTKQEPKETIMADAIISAASNQICAIQTADCLPILLCDKTGGKVAAIHAGWRGFIENIIENTVNQIGFTPGEGLAWLGPAISQPYFELGPEVYKQFHHHYPFSDIYFTLHNHRYFLNLAALAKHILNAHGIAVFGGKYCTYSQPDLFFSYRREKITGRILSAIWKDA